MSIQKQKNLKLGWQSAFWDSSAIVPLCCRQPMTIPANQIFRIFPKLIVWWSTKVECMSALARLEREQQLTIQEQQQAIWILEKHRSLWTEISPIEEVRKSAEELLSNHDIRAADSLQLAAALVWCSSHPKGKAFVGADHRLLNAAEKEGFNVIRL